MTSNITFCPAKKEGKGNLYLHKGLTWLNLSVSITSLIVFIVILERTYFYDHHAFVDKLAFLVHGPHKDSRWKFHIPPIYFLLASLLSAFMTGLLFHMDRCCRIKTLPLSASVHRKNKQEVCMEKGKELD